MIQFLQIKDFLHVKHASISFSHGLHCITGESGAGKTVILKALKLILGEKALPKEVHVDAPEAIIEAAFDIGRQPKLCKALKDAGIAHDNDEWLLVKRIIPKVGRSRQFINSQHASIFLLELIGNHLIEIVGQHAGKQLFSLGYQRTLLDEFGSRENEITAYKESFKKLKEIEKQIEELNQTTPGALEALVKEKAELDAVSARETDLEHAISRHVLFSSSKELAELLTRLSHTIDESITPQLSNLSHELERLSINTKEVTNLQETLSQALIALSEGSQSSDAILNSLSFDDEEYFALDKLIETLSSFKRRHNLTFDSIHKYYDEIAQTIESASTRDVQLQELKEQLHQTEKEVHAFAAKLTQARKEDARKLASEVTKTLHSLKMDGVTFAIVFESIPISEHGADQITFTLQNPGASASAIKEIASGGELSRILLAVKSHIAKRKSTPTLVFDEVDANIGGETATTVGNLLTKTAQYQQLICITHFPQVAAQADHLISVQKEIRQGKHEALITLLSKRERASELTRMSSY